MSKQNHTPAGSKPRSYTSVEQMPDHATSAEQLPNYAATSVGDSGKTVEAKHRDVRAALADIKRRNY